MNRTRMNVMPAKIGDLDFDSLYYEISHDWRRKAEALQSRRWRRLKHEMRGSSIFRHATK